MSPPQWMLPASNFSSIHSRDSSCQHSQPTHAASATVSVPEAFLRLGAFVDCRLVLKARAGWEAYPTLEVTRRHPPFLSAAVGDADHRQIDSQDDDADESGQAQSIPNAIRLARDQRYASRDQE